jgi:hypothetical protein
MRRLRVRFTIRCLMLLVAVVAVVVGVGVTWQRREQAQTLALFHAREQARHEDELNPQVVTKPASFDSAAEPLVFYEEWSQNPYGNRRSSGPLGVSSEEQRKANAEVRIATEMLLQAEESIRRDRDYHLQMIQRHRQLRGKYERAAAQLWEPVAPDPAPPER